MRKKLIKLIEHIVAPYFAAEIADRLIENDAVIAVRCKDCKHATFYSCKNDKCCRGIICEYQIGTDDEIFFCAYGEREEK